MSSMSILGQGDLGFNSTSPAPCWDTEEVGLGSAGLSRCPLSHPIATPVPGCSKLGEVWWFARCYWGCTGREALLLALRVTSGHVLQGC